MALFLGEMIRREGMKLDDHFTVYNRAFTMMKRLDRAFN